MTRLGLLRHGEVTGGTCFRGHTDDPLTERGFEQMRATVAKDPDWDSVVTSPLQRCAAFAEAFARQRALPLQVDHRLAELHFGDWEGRTAAEIMSESPQALKDFWHDPDHYPTPGGERLSQFRARVLDAWQQVIDTYRGQRVLVVTHSGVIRVLLCHIDQRSPCNLWAIDIKHGALFTLRIVDHAAGRSEVELIAQI